MNRDELVALAVYYDGTSAGRDRERYLDLIADGEPEPAQASMLTMSGCALTVRGLWLRMGVDDRRLRAPYHQGHAVADVVGVARDAGAWRPWPAATMPQPGDMVLIGAPEHVLTVIEVEQLDDGTWRVTSIDGGQRDEHGAQLIEKRVRIWSEHRQVVQSLTRANLGQTVGRMLADGRPVLGFADAEAICTGPVTERTRVT